MRWGTSLSHVFRPFRAYIFIATAAPTRGSAPGYDISPLWGDGPAHKPSQRCLKDTAFCRSGFSRDPAPHLHPFFAENLPKAFSGKLPEEGGGCDEGRGGLGSDVFLWGFAALPPTDVFGVGGVIGRGRAVPRLAALEPAQTAAHAAPRVGRRPTVPPGAFGSRA